MLLPFKIDPSVQAERDAVLFNTNFEDFFPEVNTNTSWRSVKPYIEQAIEDYMLPQIGEQFYNDILTKYHAGTSLTAAQNRCLRLIQVAASWYSVAYAYANKLDILTDMGNTQLNGEKSMSTPQWAFNKKYGNLLRTADKKLDNLLGFLEKQADLKVQYFKLWWLDEAYLTGKSDLFHTTDELQKFHNILDSRRTFVALIPALRDVSRLYVIPHIGVDMYNELVSQHHDSDLTTANVVLLEYVRAAAAKLALSMALETQPVFLESDGVRAVSTTEGVEKVSQERILSMSKSCHSIGLKFLDDTVTFLLKNATEYPTFKNSPLFPSENAITQTVKISPDSIGAIMF
jgi:hypothetical protein